MSNGIRIRVVDDSLNPVFTVEATAGTRVLSTLDSTSITTGSLVVYGGLGVTKNVFIGGTLNSTSVSSGTLFVSSLTVQNIVVASDLKVSLATISNLYSSFASIGQLSLISGINAPSTTIGNLVSTYASIGSINISSINVPVGSINSLAVTTASIGTLRVTGTLVGDICIFDSVSFTDSSIANLNISGSITTGSASIENLQSTNTSTSNLIANFSSISNLLATSNTFGSIVSMNLNTPSSTITNLLNTTATMGTINVTGNTSIETGSFGNFSSVNGTITSLVASSSTIGTLAITNLLNAATASIGTLVSNNLTTGTLLVNTGITTGTLLANTSINTPLATIGNFTSTNASISNLVNTVATLGNTRVASGFDVRIGYNTGGSQMLFRNSLGNNCLEVGVLSNDIALFKNVASGPIFINTMNSDIKFGYDTGTIGSTIDIVSPSSGDTVGNTGIVRVNGTLTVNSVEIFPNPGDLRKEITFSSSNNQSTPVDVVNLRFLETTTRSFICYLSVAIEATISLYAHYELRGLQMSTGTWILASEHVGDVTGIDFSIVSSGGYGQVMYTSSNETGFVSGRMAFTASTTTF